MSVPADRNATATGGSCCRGSHCFAPEIFADPKQSYVKPLFIDSWDNVRTGNALVVLRTLPKSGIFITHDQPQAVRDAIAELAAELVRNDSR